MPYEHSLQLAIIVIQRYIMNIQYASNIMRYDIQHFYWCQLQLLELTACYEYLTQITAKFSSSTAW